jgi:hypothetical protein
MPSAKSFRQPVAGALLTLAALTMAPAAEAALVISGAPGHDVRCSAGTCTATASDAVLNVGKLEHLLRRGDTQVLSGPAGTIDVEASFAWAAYSKLTLSASAITVAQPVVVQGPGRVALATAPGGLAFVRGGRLDFWEHTDLTIDGNDYLLVDDLPSLIAAANAGNPYVALARDYDAKADGTYKASPIFELFGVLNGLGHRIADLRIKSTEERAGLVGTLSGQASVSNLTLSKIDLTGGPKAFVGGLAGHLIGSASHVRVTGRVKGGDFSSVGGLAGVQEIVVLISDSSVDVAVSGGTRSVIGGIVGTDNHGSLQRCASAGRILGTNAAAVGGLVGIAVGGYQAIAGNWSSARVSGADYGGGLIGWMNGQDTIGDNYATGAVLGSLYAGGLVGNNSDGPPANPASSLQRSYSTGLVEGGLAVGGVIGIDAGDNPHSSVYWDLDASGISDPTQGAGNIANDPGLTGLRRAQLRSALPAGFDPAVWAHDPAINNGYPYLIANPPQ